MYTSAWIESLHNRFFKDFNLSTPQYNILRILRGQKGVPIGIQSITDRMIDKMSNSSRLVEKLRKKGLVDRKTCPKDRRQVEVVLTQSGSALLSQIDSQLSELQQNFYTLNKDEAEKLNELLDQLRSNE